MSKTITKTTPVAKLVTPTIKEKQLLKLNSEQELQYNKLQNKSQRIRFLRFILDIDRSKIAEYLNIRYQFVRNIEIVSTEKDLEVVKILIK